VQTENSTYTTYDRGWILRVRPADSPKPTRILLLIHGWTGDENSMWIFARNIPDDYLVLAPRGPVPGPTGYGWAALKQEKNPPVHSYIDNANRLLNQVSEWAVAHKIKKDLPVHLMGFSQGAAMCYTMLTQQPDRIAKVAGLSGFLPPETIKLLPNGYLEGKEIFIAHGTKDETVPLNQAEITIEALKQAGANIYYCKEDVGHKLGAACLKGLRDFFK
jgi:phospholipase/carboxylesterase